MNHLTLGLAWATVAVPPRDWTLLIAPINALIPTASTAPVSRRFYL